MDPNGTWSYSHLVEFTSPMVKNPTVEKSEVRKSARATAPQEVPGGGREGNLVWFFVRKIIIIPRDLWDDCIFTYTFNLGDFSW